MMKWSYGVCLLFVGIVQTANILVLLPLPAPSHFHCFYPLVEKLLERGHNMTVVTPIHFDNDRINHVDLPGVQKHFHHHNCKLFITHGGIHSIIESVNAAVPVLGLPFFSEQSYNVKIMENLGVGIMLSDIEKHELETAVNKILNDSRSQTQIEKYFNFDKENVPHIKDIMRNISVTLVNSHYSFGYVKPDLPNVVNVAGIHLTSPTNLPQVTESANILVVAHLPHRSHFVSFQPLWENLIERGHNLTIIAGFELNKKFQSNYTLVDVKPLFGKLILLYEFIYLPRSQTQIEKYFNFDKENVPHIKDILRNISVTLVNSHYSFGYIKPNLPNVVDVAGIHLIPPTNLPVHVFAQFFPDDHPKCRLFITHGGIHSLLESLNASVPFLGIPFFGDQLHNLLKAEYFGIGTALNIDDISTELPLKINEVLYNQKYKENIVKRSQLFRERLNNPMETALYWIDHVLKHKDTSHLKSASTQLSWYELYSVDVLIIVAVIFWIAMKIIGFIIRRTTQKLMSLKNVISPKAESGLKKRVTNNLKCD
ncbi:hypothetical protein V9T40_011677 [Parthenolecanium corni]|uniref:UDP-glycosyltransferase n=1 Tax=Parthenolecanium corni TaxID=536013 RepID=A0AAN9TLH7_9HEMI